MTMKTFIENMHFSTVLVVSNTFWGNANYSMIGKS